MTREYVFRRGEHTFFEPLLGFAINVASMATAMEAYTLGFARPFEPQHHVTIAGVQKVSAAELLFFPYELMHRIGGNQTLDSIRVFERPIAHVEHPITVGTLKGVYAEMATSSFVRYFETVKARCNATFGDQRSWPAPLRFAKVVRDALVHNGAIGMRPGTPSVSWRSLTYSENANGRSLLYVDVTAVELILLMVDMDDCLRSS